MKHLKSKLLGLSAILIAVIIFNACQQEPIVPEIVQENDMMSKIELILEDNDVQSLMNIMSLINTTINDRIEANRAEYENYVETDDYEAIEELLYSDDIVELMDEAARLEQIVTEKYPDFWEIDFSIIQQYNTNEINSRWCWNYAYWQCKWSCDYFMSYLDCAEYCHDLWCE